MNLGDILKAHKRDFQDFIFSRLITIAFNFHVSSYVSRKSLIHTYVNSSSRAITHNIDRVVPSLGQTQSA